MSAPGFKCPDCGGDPRIAEIAKSFGHRVDIAAARIRDSQAELAEAREELVCENHDRQVAEDLLTEARAEIERLTALSDEWRDEAINWKQKAESGYAEIEVLRAQLAEAEYLLREREGEA